MFLREAGGMPEDTAPEAMQALAGSIAPKGPENVKSPGKAAKPKKARSRPTARTHKTRQR